MKPRTEPTVGIADLKARLSEHLHRVRKGGALTVVDRRTPVARGVPFEEVRREELVVRHGKGRFADFRPSAAPKKRTHSLAVLRELRKERL